MILYTKQPFCSSLANMTVYGCLQLNTSCCCGTTMANKHMRSCLTRLCPAELVSCAQVASVLDLTEQQCQLLLDTLAAVGGSSSVQGPGLEPLVDLHELSLFLLAQIYGREAHRCARSIYGAGAAPTGNCALLGMCLQPCSCPMRQQHQEQQRLHSYRATLRIPLCSSSAWAITTSEGRSTAWLMACTKSWEATDAIARPCDILRVFCPLHVALMQA